MKLSKRFAAATIAICMLLMSFSALAAQYQMPNESMILPTDGSAVAVTSTGLGHQNDSVGIVIDAASAKALGINVAELSTTSILTEDTSYDGLLLSGKMKARNLTYDVNATSGTAVKIREIMENDELVEFDFADVEVTRIRANGAGTAVVLEIAYQAYMDGVVPGTAKKVAEGKITGDETEAVTFTEDDLYVLSEAECANLKGMRYRSEGDADFYGAGSDGYLASNLVAKAGADYKTGIAIDSVNFPKGTIFISSAKLNANGATLSSLTDWMATSAGYSSGYNSFSGTSAPFGDYVAQEDGEYYVYALKTAYDSNGSRYAKALINGVDFVFRRDHVPASLPDGVKGWYWEKDGTNTLTLSKGGMLSVQVNCSGYAYSRLAGLALVPVEKVAEMEAITNWNDFRDGNRFSANELANLHELTTVEYVPADPVEATIKVNGADVVVSSDDAETVTTVSSSDFYNAIIKNVTVMDALVAAGIVNADNVATYNKNINVKLNGLTITNYDKWVLFGGEEITAVFNDVVDVTNFSPVKVSSVYSNLGGGNKGIKLCFNLSNTANTSISFIHNGTGYVSGAMQGANLSGYASTTQAVDVIPKGSKVYFDETRTGFDGTVVTSGTHGLNYVGVLFYSTDSTMVLDAPDGSKVHHPYYIKQHVYNFDNVYVTNSSTTNKVKARYLENSDAWQLYTDGFKKVTIFKIAQVNGYNKVTEIVDADVVVGAPYKLELAEGEKAFVWGSSPFDGEGEDGITMVPLLTIE